MSFQKTVTIDREPTDHFCGGCKHLIDHWPFYYCGVYNNRLSMYIDENPPAINRAPECIMDSVDARPLKPINN